MQYTRPRNTNELSKGGSMTTPEEPNSAQAKVTEADQSGQVAALESKQNKLVKDPEGFYPVGG